MESLIIDRPSKRTLKQRYIDNSLKVLMLLGWLYFCLPAITFGVWYIAYTFFNQHLILLEGYKEYKNNHFILVSCNYCQYAGLDLCLVKGE